MRQTFLVKTVLAAEAVVDFDIAAADLGGSEGAVATDQAERTVGDCGGNVTPIMKLTRKRTRARRLAARMTRSLTRSEMVDCGRVL